MAEDNIDLEFLAEQGQTAIEEMRHPRKKHAETMHLIIANHELTRRVERRHHELRDHFEIIIKMEIGGAFTNMHSVIEGSLARIEQTMSDIAERLDSASVKS
jgi:hypothetical protein